MTFDRISDLIKGKAATAKPIGGTLKFDLDDGCIYLDGSGDTNVVSNEDKDADCVINVSQDNFVKVIKGEMNPTMAFMTGKIKLDGDMSMAMKLQSLLG